MTHQEILEKESIIYEGEKKGEEHNLNDLKHKQIRL